MKYNDSDCNKVGSRKENVSTGKSQISKIVALHEIMRKLAKSSLNFFDIFFLHFCIKSYIKYLWKVVVSDSGNSLF